MTHLITRFLYMLADDSPSWTYISIDIELRQIFKKILHRPASTSTGFLCTRKRDGGLGLPGLAHLLTLVYLRARAALCRMKDTTLKSLCLIIYRIKCTTSQPASHVHGLQRWWRSVNRR
jgi:hypothetical protein